MNNLSHIPFQEKRRIKEQFSSLLIDNFYTASFLNICIGLFCSILYLFYYYGDVQKEILVSWFIIVNLCTTAMFVQLLFYKVYKNFSRGTSIYFTIVTIYSIAWGFSIIFIHPDLANPYITLSVIPVIAATMTICTMGSFLLFSICASFILIPLIIWCFWQSGHFYWMAGEFSILYLVLLFMINYRSTEYLKNAILFKLETEHFNYEANHDVLTNLPNQRLLIQLLEDAIKKAKKNDSEFALICFGINDVETFNSALGYQGDLIIQTIANTIETQFKAKMQLDKISRQLTLPRSDVFAIIIDPNINVNLKNNIHSSAATFNKELVDREIHSLFEALELPFHAINKDKHKLTASIGVSTFPNDALNARKLLSNAYSAMFKAKLSSPNSIEFHHKMEESIHEKSATETKEIKEESKVSIDTRESKRPIINEKELEKDLRHALTHNEFDIYYQPIINLRSGQVEGLEALIRWHHPKRGLISPLEFIPVAEKTGLIIDIGKWVLEKTALQTRDWHHQGFNTLSLKVGVNLSIQELRNGNLLETLDKTMKKTGLLPQYLDLEITEASLLDEELIPLIQEISNKGINLSLDDFGTGFTSLNYLKKFNIGTIKIDRSLIQKLPFNTQTAMIVSAILAMSKELGIKTMAEGVETEEQLAFLEERDCMFVQGYYFCKPLNVDKFTRLLKSHLRFFKNSERA